MIEMRLYDLCRNRLYSNREERISFLNVTRMKSSKIRAFAKTLYYTGCRVSEALECTPKRVELTTGQIILRILKKRREDIFRAITTPAHFLDTLNTAHGIREAQNIAVQIDVWKATHRA